jgi:Caspase domain
MTLYWPDDPNKIDLTGPRLHAFIIGVGDYPHLLAGAPNAFGTNFGLQQLTTTVLTAKKIAKWLATEYNNPTVPLGSIELFLSPGQEVERPDGTKVQIEDATLANIEAVFKSQWLDKRCKAQPGGITWFYFAGHGLTHGGAQYLLLSDFSDPNKNKWQNCIDFTSTRKGMGKIKATQLFFVDACRENPIEILTGANPPTGARLYDEAGLYDHPDAEGVYYAAADGRLAYGPDDDITYFATALIESLEGAGAEKSKGQFPVDTATLGTAIHKIVNSLAAILKKPLLPSPQPAGKVVPIHLAKGIHAWTAIWCRTDQANQQAVIKLLQNGAPVFDSPVGDKRPWFGRLPFGDWDLEVKFATYPEHKSHEEVEKTVHEVEVPV